MTRDSMRSTIVWAATTGGSKNTETNSVICAR